MPLNWKHTMVKMVNFCYVSFITVKKDSVKEKPLSPAHFAQVSLEALGTCF